VLIGGQADRNRTAFETNSARFETFDGGKGNDFIDGGSGFDYAIYNRGIGAPLTKGIHVMLADGIVIGDADVFGTDTLRGVEIVVGTQLDDIFDGRGFGLNSTNRGYDSRDYGLIPVIDEVPGAYNEFEGGAGNDLIYGNGYTLLRYSKATGGITADLTKTDGAITGNVSVGIDSIAEVGQVRSLIGTDYADVITGNAFDNYIQGGFSKTSAGDIIDGGAGNDFIQAGSGNDKITGGTGDDMMGGGSPLPGTGQVSSNDTFYFETGHGKDTIFDFNLSASNGEVDVIVLEGTSITSFAELMAHVVYEGSFTHIFTDGDNDTGFNTLDGDVITINTPGITPYTPLAQHFIFLP
jgi:Ca2+-binding RTX toxin-like protein